MEVNGKHMDYNKDNKVVKLVKQFARPGVTRAGSKRK